MKKKVMAYISRKAAKTQSFEGRYSGTHKSHLSNSLMGVIGMMGRMDALSSKTGHSTLPFLCVLAPLREMNAFNAQAPLCGNHT